ncbi:MAG: diguanylate cyclase [Deltaproteobacteria bacterium]
MVTESCGEGNNNGMQVMLVEDSADQGLMVCRILHRDCDITCNHALSRAEALKCLRENHVDLMLLDYNLSDCTALELLEDIEREIGQTPPFIVMTGYGDENLAVNMMKRGARDYLVKQDNFLRDLPVTVNRVLADIGLERRHEASRREMREKETRYFQLFQSSRSIMLMVDPENGKIMDANAAACAFYGYNYRRLTTMRMTTISQDPPNEVMKSALEADNEQNNHFETRHKLANGEIRDVEVFSNPVDFGDKRYLFSIIHDVTERKQAQEALKYSENLYRTIFQATGTASIIVDNDTTILLANDEFAKLSGYSREEIEKKMSWTKFVVPEDLERMVNYHRERRKSQVGVPIKYEFRFVNRSGQIFTCINTIGMVPGSKRSIASVMDITERKMLENQLRILATTDPLTGAYNRRTFFELGAAEFARSLRYRHGMSVLMMDIDHFKLVNDKYGHNVGDVALSTLVANCMSILRGIDILGRLGGEEFSIILPHTSGKEAMLAAERLRQVIEKSIMESDNAVFFITVSIGVSEIKPDDLTIDDILKRADHALYKAKNNGRNRVEMD